MPTPVSTGSGSSGTPPFDDANAFGYANVYDRASDEREDAIARLALAAGVIGGGLVVCWLCGTAGRRAVGWANAWLDGAVEQTQQLRRTAHHARAFIEEGRALLQELSALRR